MNKLKNKKGFFPLWLGMQEAICGIKPKASLHPGKKTDDNAKDDDDDDQLPDLGLFIIYYLFSITFLCLFS